MNRQLGLWLLSAACCFGLTTYTVAAWGYACVSSSCAGHCNTPVPYRLQKPSDDLGLANTEAELKRGMEAWTKPSCSGLKLQYGGTTTDAPSNGNGVVTWVESGWQSGSGVIGVTTMRLSRGCLTSHMAMNGVNFRWVAGTPASRGQVSAFTIVAHEGGHYLGLGHSNAAGAVMAARYSGGVIPLNADDEAGICRIYPGGGGMAVPDAPGAGGAGGSTDGGGSGGAGGTSGGGNGNGQLCAACLTGVDCASGTCLRNNNTGERFCGRPCSEGCPSRFSCMSADGTQGVQQCVPPNGSCAGVSVPSSPAGAGGGAGTAMPQGGQSGNGGQDAQGGSDGMSAAECTDDNDCASQERCDANAKCVADDDDARIVVADGESCEVNDECQSRLCLEANNKNFCSRLCSSNADCVSGFACRDSGDDKVCLPIEEGEESEEDEDMSEKPKATSKSNGGCAMGAQSRGSGALVMFVAVLLRRRLGRRRQPRTRG